MSLVKHYENRQEGYIDRYAVEYRTEPDGTISVWSPEHPPNRFDTSVAKCHLYSSGKICIASGREPRSMEVAEAIAHYWMMGYSVYVRMGEFPDPGARVSV
jgi:hypothetical protein